MFKKLIWKIGLSGSEIKVILFLAGALLLGFGAKLYFRNTESYSLKDYNYQSEDSLFNLAEFSSSKKNIKTSSQTVDYKQEVLDFKKLDFSKVGKKQLPPEKSININLAGIPELMKLPGIGKVTAKKIVDFRKENGSFKNLKEIIEVKGIGPSKLNNIKKYIFINIK